MENEKMMTADDAVETNAAAATAVEINDDAKAEERTTEDSQLSMQTIAAAEALSVIDNVINNTLKLMSGKYGGGFYVNYLQDSGQKTGCLQLIIVYPDENYKRLFLAKNCFLPIEIDGDGIGKIESGDSSYTPKLRESMNYGNFRILEKYETPNMPIPSEVIWKQVIRNYEKIPVVTVYHSEDIEGIYWELYRVAHDDAIANFAAVHRENDVRFLVTKDEMERVACENGITLSQLRTELNLLGVAAKMVSVTTRISLPKRSMGKTNVSML